MSTAHTGHSSSCSQENKNTTPLLSGAIFRFCAQSMRYPDVQWLTRDYLSALSQLLESLGAESEMGTIKESAVQQDFIENIEKLQVEYTRLFINARPHVIAPPYGSAYINHTLAGKFTEDIHLFYRKNGYDLRNKNDFADHLIHQLEFLTCITEAEKFEVQHDFLFRFFRPWFEEFSHRVRNGAQMPFYPVIISLIDFFTKEEEEYGV